MKNKRTIFLASAACAMILAAGIGSASAYFSTYTDASGSYKISLNPSTEIHEPDIDENGKHIEVENTGSTDVYVRVKAFAGGDVDLTYTPAEGNWTTTPDSEGYVYYTDASGELLPLSAGETTNTLYVGYKRTSEGKIGDTYNVIVVYEATPVLYDENGNPYADWSLSIDSAEEGGDQS